MVEEFEEMSTDDLEEMKRKLMAELDEVKEFNEDQAQKQDEVEKEQTRLLEDILKREFIHGKMEDRMLEIL